MKAKKESGLPHLITNSNVYATFSDECIFGDDNDQLTSTYGDYGTFNAMPRPQSAATYHDSNTGGEAGGLISKQASTDMLIEQPPSSNNKRTTKSGRASKKSKSREPLGRNQGGGSQPCLLMSQQHQVWSH